jgi:hypothetical protein
MNIDEALEYIKDNFSGFEAIEILITAYTEEKSKREELEKEKQELIQKLEEDKVFFKAFKIERTRGKAIYAQEILDFLKGDK